MVSTRSLRIITKGGRKPIVHNLNDWSKRVSGDEALPGTEDGSLPQRFERIELEIPLLPGPSKKPVLAAMVSSLSNGTV